MADAKTERQKVKEITEKLEQGIKELFESEKYKSYLNTMSKFHNYSFNNTVLIAMQKPDATLVAGFNSWKKNFKRHVKKGEKGTDRGRLIMATVQGDIHDIGKNIVGLLLENYGYTVIDLGKDVPPEAVVEAVLENHAPLAGLSALMTTTVPAMEETVKLLREKAPFCKIVVGGAVLTEEYARDIGADAYGKDAMATVRYAEETV